MAITLVHDSLYRFPSRQRARFAGSIRTAMLTTVLPEDTDTPRLVY